MKRDLEMVRDILLVTEENEESSCSSNKILTALSEKGYDSPRMRDELKYHLKLMDQDGLIECEIRIYFGGAWTEKRPVEMTSYGHDYLNAVRDKGIWSKVKEKAGNKIDSLSIGLIKTVANEFIKESLK